MFLNPPGFLSGGDSTLTAPSPPRNRTGHFRVIRLGPLRSPGSLQRRRSITNALFADGSAEASIELSLDLRGPPNSFAMNNCWEVGDLSV